MQTHLLVAALLLAACAGPRRDAAPAAEAPAADPLQAHAKRADEALTEIDLDHDGKTDVWKFSRRTLEGKQVVVRQEKDLNGDGKIDVWEEYGEDGVLVKQTFDLDFDGKPDVTLFLEKGQLVRKEYAFAFDGKPRAWAFYEKNKLVRRERDLDGDGKIDVWEYWENGEIDRIGIDVDHDGRIDRWENRRSPGAATPAPASRGSSEAGADAQGK